ncbi:MAG: DUF362 domain-containing protein, partial [Desulfovibrio sp.]|nr:DUF362 domain-containing protein [Desulfovibrio sp.]
EIYSVARVKAHSQTRLTLCAKNCFGCVPGWRKALVHASHGQTTEIFAAFLAELYKSLPPVKGVADGVIAMHITGPAKGAPYPLGLVGASNLATALDEAIIRALKRPVADFPLAARFGASKEIFYPFLKPEDFDANGFILPEKLKPASFSPVRLLKSAIKRLWMSGKS